MHLVSISQEDTEVQGGEVIGSNVPGPVSAKPGFILGVPDPNDHMGPEMVSADV